MSINATLTCLGYTTAPGNYGRKRIMFMGAEVFAGTAGDVWAWLRETGAIS